MSNSGEKEISLGGGLRGSPRKQLSLCLAFETFLVWAFGNGQPLCGGTDEIPEAVNSRKDGGGLWYVLALWAVVTLSESSNFKKPEVVAVEMDKFPSGIS